MPECTPTLICHRGFWWPDLAAQNGATALRDAFAAGFAAEVDPRRHPGVRGTAPSDLVLSHDLPPQTEPRLWWSRALDLAAERGGALFVNVKEAGTEAELARSLASRGLTASAWLFDFELAGANPLKAKAAALGVRCLARVSDRGEGAEVPAWADGVWLDQWGADWVTAEVLAGYAARGLPAFVVSPELHGRALDLRAAEAWRGASGICTDVPHLYRAVWGGNPAAHPADPWWP